jgi:hypothetical protein
VIVVASRIELDAEEVEITVETDARIQELLSRWEQTRRQGLPPSA